MSASAPTARPDDPIMNFRFHVEIDGLVLAGFTEVSGLEIEIETETYQEGGVNDYTHFLPKRIKHRNLELKQGLSASNVLYQWLSDVAGGKVTKRSGRILLMDSQGTQVWHWTFEGAFPVKWSGVNLRSTGGEVFIETLELTHQGIKKQKD